MGKGNITLLASVQLGRIKFTLPVLFTGGKVTTSQGSAQDHVSAGYLQAWGLAPPPTDNFLNFGGLKMLIAIFQILSK